MLNPVYSITPHQQMKPSPTCECSLLRQKSRTRFTKGQPTISHILDLQNPCQDEIWLLTPPCSPKSIEKDGKTSDTSILGGSEMRIKNKGNIKHS